MANKGELVQFLNSRVFDKILNARSNDYKESQKDDLQYVQRATRDEKDRYEHYRSAEEVINMFKDDLRSPNAKPVNNKLKELGLPRLEDVKDEFLKKAA